MAKGLVEKVEVANKSQAKVYVRVGPATGGDAGMSPGMGSPQLQQPGAQYKFFFNIGSIESFERKMEEAQEALGEGGAGAGVWVLGF